MGLRSWMFVALLGGLAHLILFLVDREAGASIDRLSEVRLMHRHVLIADPDLQLVGARSPYMRDERY